MKDGELILIALRGRWIVIYLLVIVFISVTHIGLKILDWGIIIEIILGIIVLLLLRL